MPREHGEKGCCDVVNHGVAVHRGKAYVASYAGRLFYDGRLFALDAAPGKVVWRKDTIADRSRPYVNSGGNVPNLDYTNRLSR